MEQLIQRLRQIAGARTPDVLMYAPELQVFGGFETLEPPCRYDWDGLKRGADPAHPYMVFQYTLEGWGYYAAQGATQRLQPGMAFSAIIPSEHRYYLPAASSGWTYFWILIRHPYIIQRIAQRQQESGAVLTIAPDSPLILRALDLFEYVCRPTNRDALAHERALFEFFWEHERAARQGSLPPNQAEQLLDQTRRYIVGALARPIAVAELAAVQGLSRSHFSHIFKSASGIGPAQFIQQIRLEEATRRLLHTQQSIGQIACATGFANANHFCKVFRQRFHLSPGAFRRQMR
jgi:AraC-like DNA-binding protein